MHCGRSVISSFQGLFASIGKIFNLAGGLGTELSFCGFQALSWYFLISLKSFGDSSDNSYVLCLPVIIVHRFTCGERKVW